MEGQGKKRGKKNRPAGDPQGGGEPQQQPQGKGSAMKQQQPDPAPEQMAHAQGSEPMAAEQPQQKGKYKQKKQQQQQQEPEPTESVPPGPSSTEQTAEQKPTPGPSTEGEQPKKGKYKQKKPQEPKQESHLPDPPPQTTEQQPNPVTEEEQVKKSKYKQKQQQKQQQAGGEPEQMDQNKLTYKQKQLLKQQKQQKQQEGEQQQQPSPIPSGSQQPQEQGKGSYKQKQQQHPKEQPFGQVTSFSHAPSPPHAAALERIAEDFSNIKIDKQKLHSSHLLPILTRNNTSGNCGTKIKVEVNYIQLFVDRLIPKAYHYDVDIQPAASRKWQRWAFSQFCREMFPNIGLAFDGHKNAYAARRMKDDYYSKEVEVRGDGRARRFKITMKEAAVLDMTCLKNYMTSQNSLEKPMSAIQCLDIVLRTAYENNPAFIKFKKSIYVKPARPEDIGSNHELWYGLFQSALLGAKPFLNIDVSHKAFPSGGPVLEILKGINRDQLPDRPLTDNQCKELHDFLKGMELAYTGPDGVSKLFKYNSVKGPANAQKFKNADGKELTIEAYFRLNNRKLKYPHLPTLHVGSTIRNIMLPIELCTIPSGQALNKKHPDKCTQNIIKKSATDTGTRKRKIMDLFNQINYNNAPTIKEFGVGVGTSFEVVDGRVIEPPNLLYAGSRSVKPIRGVWRADNLGYVVPSTQVTKRSLNWVILNLDSRTRPDAIEHFGRDIYNMSLKQNVQLQPFSMQTNYHEPRDMRNCVRELDTIFNDLKKRNIDLAIVVIPNPGRDVDFYAKVKQKAELCVGLLTQCIKSYTLDRKRGDQSTISNIWLKINAKTNGTNHVLHPHNKPHLLGKGVMYIGADVTHPSPEQNNIPSVVGVAASYDLEGFRYNCCYRLQGPRDEMIRDLQNIVAKQLKQFGQQNQILPEVIMYYRDGVSEGQFQEVLTIELRAIQAAAASVKPGYKPKITFIVVQKRHHARFFPTANYPTEGRNNNVLPGTIVDKHITAPNQFQFFLVSHAAVQGVAKPTKYCVLYDDNNFLADVLQGLTYCLCHMFTRCNRAVSYPAPTYYAHLAAYRGRVYIKDRNLNMNNLVQEYERMQIRSEIQDGHPMFFV